MSLNPKYDVETVKGSSNVTIKKATCVLKAVYVTITNAGDNITFCDNSTTNSNTQFTVEATSLVSMPLINKTFLNGLTLSFTGSTAKYVLVFE